MSRPWTVVKNVVGTTCSMATLPPKARECASKVMKVPTMSLWMRGTYTLVAAYVLLYLFDWSLFSWHPLCMTLGYAVLMAEAVRIAVDFRSKEGQERVKRITRHMMVNLGALALITVGFASIYKNKASVRLDDRIIEYVCVCVCVCVPALFV